MLQHLWVGHDTLVNTGSIVLLPSDVKGPVVHARFLIWYRWLRELRVYLYFLGKAP